MNKYPTLTEALICQEISRFGPMTFAQFMDIALYHPQLGYHSKGLSQRGKQGDYFTSFQVSPLFSEILMKAVADIRESMDSDVFSLVEFGSGNGEFLEYCLDKTSQDKRLSGIRVIAVERSQSARKNLVKRLSRFPKCSVVSSLDELDLVGGLEGCVFSNEFFDALPFHRLKYTPDGFQEIGVDVQGGHLVEKLIPLSEQLRNAKTPFQDLKFEPDQEIEFSPFIKPWFQQVAENFYRGIVLTFDYGYPRQSLYSARRGKGTWHCFSEHTVDNQPFDAVGRKDITAHVDFTALAEAGQPQDFLPALFSSQGIFLTHVGQHQIERYLTEALPEQKAKRIGAVQQLIHPDAMGESFSVFAQTRDTNLPPSFQAVPNRLARLFPR